MSKIKANMNRLKLKLIMSHYDHKSISDAKFESGSSSGFGDMKSQIFPQKTEMSHQIRVFILRKRV